MIEHPCGECEATGQIVEERTLEVEVPPGIHDGQQIRLSGEGHAGLLGGRAGDLYVLVRIRPDARFVREGNDIFATVGLTMTEAALGTTVRVPTLITSGRHDECTPSLVEPLHAGITGSEWVIFEDSAHMAYLEEPERYLEVVGDFLDGSS